MTVERSFSSDGSELTITLGEKFDFGNVQDFRAAYSDGAQDVTSIKIDLENTEYMDSSALGMLLNMQKCTADKVTEFSIVNCRPTVKKILKVSRFDRKFIIS